MKIMRSIVYRNLDQPFQVMGFRIVELVAICVMFVIGGEVADFTGIHRGWSFIVALIFAAGCFVVRRSLGEMFFERLLRFLALPSSLSEKLFLSFKGR